LSGTTRVSRHQKGETNPDFTEARDSEWQWHQPGHMQVRTSLQTDNHTSTPPLSFFTGRMPFLPPNQQCQSTEGEGYETENKKDLSSLLKVLIDSALRIMSGRLFQAVAPANAKVHLPNWSRVCGTMRWPLDTQRSDDLAVDDETNTDIDLM